MIRELEIIMDVLTLPAYYRRSRRYLDRGARHLLMYVFGRFSMVRSFMVWLYSQGAPKPPLTSSSSLIGTADVDDVVLKIHRDGFCPDLNLRKEVVEELLTFCSLATCFAEGNEGFPFRYADRDVAQKRAGRPFRLGRYNHALCACPVLQALASDTQLLAIARKYLCTEPVLIGARIWWSLAGPADDGQRGESGQSFHYDIDGYRALAFFFYLTDVGQASGPHVFVRGTHMKKSWRHLVSLYKGRTDAEITKCYGPENQVLLCGPAGSGFAEDIFGFHKGMGPESVDRLIVQVRYGIRDYGTGRDD
jgi:hypothetical protein